MSKWEWGVLLLFAAELVSKVLFFFTQVVVAAGLAWADPDSFDLKYVINPERYTYQRAKGRDNEDM